MSEGFLVWPEFHPVLVGAGCLALGYVYGWHCRAASEIPPDEPEATDQDACCAQSQSNTYLERCKCCMSAPAELDTGKGKGSKFFTRSPYLIQDAAEGFEQAERSAKRDLEHRNSMDLYGHHRDGFDCTEGEAHGMHHRSSSHFFVKSNQMLKEERVLQAKAPYKKQKGTPAMKETSTCSKGRAEVSREGDEDDDTAAELVPWSQEVLNKRIEYFNNATSETSGTGRSDESRKLRHFKKSFSKARAAEGEATYNSISTSSHNSGGAERSPCGGLVPLAAPDHVDCSHDNSPNSPHRISGGELLPQPVQIGSVQAPETLGIVDRLHTGNGEEEGSKVAVPDADATEMVGENLNLESTAVAASSEMLQTELSSAQAPEHDHVPGRSPGRMELKEEVPEDKVLKAEIYGLLNEADCNKVSFQGIVSLLEERLQTDLQESKAHIATLVREVVSISKILEEEGLPGEVESEQSKATDIHKGLSSSSSRLGKSPVSSNLE